MYVGIGLSVFASFLFAGLYYYASFLNPLTGTDIFAWRIALVCPIIALLLLINRDLGLIKAIFQRMKTNRLLLPALLLSSALIGVQQWLFMWAPVNGRGLQVSIGYFLLPLTMIFVGRVLYKERLSILQKIAAGLALLGVANEIWMAQSFSWEALLVALGFPCYFVLRRTLNTDNTGGFLLDLIFLMPICLWLVWDTATLVSNEGLKYKLIGLAAISAIAFLCHIISSKLLPMGLFGLLGNVEPVLLVIASLLLGESIEEDQWLTFLPIWLSVIVLTVEGALIIIKRKSKKHFIETH